MSSDRDKAILWARSFLSRPANVILDTETTGLDAAAEIVQIAAINVQGGILLNTLVNPGCLIPSDARRIHGITNEMVKDAPMWNAVYPRLQAITVDNIVVTYNADYDLRLIRQAGRRFGYLGTLEAAGVECAMLAYAVYYGEWDDWHGNYKWQKLTGGDHSALGDCRATLDLLKKMASTTLESEGEHA